MKINNNGYLIVATLALLSGSVRAVVIAQTKTPTINVPVFCSAGDGVQIATRTILASATPEERASASSGAGMVCSNHDRTLSVFGYVPPNLGQAQIAMNSKIDQNTAAVIARGFDWTPPSAAFGTPATRMSLSSKAKEIYHGLLTADSRGIANYPIVVGGLSDIDLVPLQGSADVLSLYGAAMAAVQTQETVGLQLKAQVLAAATVADVIAVVDSR